MPRPKETMKVIFENSKVRVVELVVEKGTKAPMHSHPSYLVYAVSPFQYKSTSPEGRSERRSLKQGEVEWSEGESHEVAFQRPGTALVVELK